MYIVYKFYAKKKKYIKFKRIRKVYIIAGNVYIRRKNMYIYENIMCGK